MRETRAGSARRKLEVQKLQAEVERAARMKRKAEDICEKEKNLARYDVLDSLIIFGKDEIYKEIEAYLLE